MTLGELAGEFQVSTKTIRRDLKILESVFGRFSVDKEAHGRKRYFFEHSPFTFGLSLSGSELLALYVGQKMMSSLEGTYFWSEIEHVYKKFRGLLSRDAIEYAERMIPFFYQFKLSQPHYNKKDGELINAILVAMEESKVLQVLYRSVKSERAKKYNIWPYTFVFWQGSVYLVGYSCKDKENRFWKADRFLDAKVLDNEYFERPVDFDVDAMMANVVVPYVGASRTVLATIRFSGYAAKIVQEENLRTIRQIRRKKGNVVYVEMEVEPGKSFLRWVMKFGALAEIISPPELRDTIKEELQATIKLYDFPTAHQSGPSV